MAEFEFGIDTPLTPSSFNDVTVSVGVNLNVGTIIAGPRQIVGLIETQLVAVETFDISALPAGAVISAAKIEFLSFSTQSVSFAMVIDCIRENPTEDAIQAVPTATASKGRFVGSLTQFLTDLSATNTTTAPDTTLRIYMDGRDGLDFRCTQMFTIDTAGNATHGIFKTGHGPNAIGTGTFHFELWSVTGTAGSYVKNAMLTTGVATGGVLENISAGQSNSFLRCAPAAGPSQAVLPGEVYALEVVFVPNGDAAADSYIEVGLGTNIQNFINLGFPDNMQTHATTTMQGYSQGTNFLHANAIREATQVNTGATLPDPLFETTDGELVSIGDEFFDPDVVLNDITRIVQDAVAQQTQGRIAFRYATTFNPLNAQRQWHSSRSTTPTKTNPDRFGTLLTISTGAGVFKAQGIATQNNVAALAASQSQVAQSLDTQANTQRTLNTQGNVHRTTVTSRNVSATVGIGDPNGGNG